MTQLPEDMPEAFGSYVVDSHLGKDDVGNFYLSHHRELGSKAVVKWVHAAVAGRQSIERLFRHDAQVSAQADHPGLIRVIDLGNVGGREYLVMEYVEGETLAERLERGPLHGQHALEVAESLAETLDVLFSNLTITNPGIFPRNVRLGKKGEVKLCRVNLKKLFEMGRTSDSSYGQADDDCPTSDIVAYVAPERIADFVSADAQGDVFELGAVLYHMLTGKPLFTDLSERLGPLAGAQVPALPSTLPEEVLSLLSRMLAREPSARHQSYSHLRSDLRRATMAIQRQKPHVFVSAKSQDYEHARSVYEYLIFQAIPTFFSEQSLRDLASADYRREIDRALDETTHLIVVTSSADNTASPWVEAEWGFFVNEKRSGRKHGNLVTLLVGDVSPRELPPSLRYYEAIPYGKDALRKLLEYVRAPSS